MIKIPEAMISTRFNLGMNLTPQLLGSLRQPQLFHLGARLICVPPLMNKLDVKH
jgi:hypothetical protein